jgi:V/A-type H+-transporting ATPase subunit A
MQTQQTASSSARVVSINGPVLQARGMSSFRMREMVRVGTMGLLGEVIRMQGDEATLQIYEDTQG